MPLPIIESQYTKLQISLVSGGCSSSNWINNKSFSIRRATVTEIFGISHIRKKGQEQVEIKDKRSDYIEGIYNGWTSLLIDVTVLLIEWRKWLGLLMLSKSLHLPVNLLYVPRLGHSKTCSQLYIKANWLTIAVIRTQFPCSVNKKNDVRRKVWISICFFKKRTRIKEVKISSRT